MSFQPIVSTTNSLWSIFSMVIEVTPAMAYFYHQPSHWVYETTESGWKMTPPLPSQRYMSLARYSSANTTVTDQVPQELLLATKPLYHVLITSIKLHHPSSSKTDIHQLLTYVSPFSHLRPVSSNSGWSIQHILCSLHWRFDGLHRWVIPTKYKPSRPQLGACLNWRHYII